MAINSINGLANQINVSASVQRAALQPSTRTTKTLPEFEDASQQSLNSEQVQKAVETVEQLVEVKSPNSLTFSIDDESGKTVVKITDANTGETIRQIPAEEILEITRSLEKMKGMLLRQEA